MVGHLVMPRHLLQHPRRLVHRLERKFETPVMHRHEPFCAGVLERLQRFVGSHVNVPERIGIIRADGEQRDLGMEPVANFLEALEIGAVARVVNRAALMLQHEPAIAAVLIAQRARAPVLAGRERHRPVRVRKAFPLLQLDDPGEAQPARQVAHAPRHHADFRRGQAA